MTDKKSVPASKTEPRAAGKRPRKPLTKSSADAKGDFFFDELMTAQPDATQAYFRQQLMKHVAKKPETDGK